MTDGTPTPCRITFNPNDQEIVLWGELLPAGNDALADLDAVFQRALAECRGVLFVNVKRLTRINNLAFNYLAGLVRTALAVPAGLRVRIITSSVLGWSTRKFRHLEALSPAVQVEEYDSEFYPGQAFLEEGGFIPILRTQTRMTWHHEKTLLARHGLAPGMNVADICCGIGDFALLLYKEYAPDRLLALDHSRTSLDYARQVAAEFGVTGIEFVYGDAAEMLIDDGAFDFVTCRHALQIFDEPERILAELFRICKPGGRVYCTNEKISHCVGEPRGESVQWTYTELAGLFRHYDMDLEYGPKSARALERAGFTDIRVDCFMVSNLDGDREGFAAMVESWDRLFSNDMSLRRGDDDAYRQRLHQGFLDHAEAARHGYAGWPVWIASGKRPL